MKEIIYQNEESSLEAHFDGELIELTQTYEGQVIGTISLYKDEFDRIKEFIDKESKSEERYRAVLYNKYENLPESIWTKPIRSVWFDTREEAEKAGEGGLELYGGDKYEIEVESESKDD